MRRIVWIAIGLGLALLPAVALAKPLDFAWD
jgi:hypothetical protein